MEIFGAGTVLGNSIELKALGKIMPQSDIHPLCWIDAVKSNIGHLEGGFGTATRADPPLAEFHFLHPNIDIKNTRLTIPTDLIAWKNKLVSTRRAGVSSFGFGGTNIHIVMEAAQHIIVDKSYDSEAM